MEFKINQRVVCIARDGSWETCTLKKLWFFSWIKKRFTNVAPRYNKIYTVTEFCFNISHQIHVVQLKEFPAGDIFNASCFRPLEEAFAEEAILNVEKRINEMETIEELEEELVIEP